MYWWGEWALINPNFRHVGIFDLLERQCMHALQKLQHDTVWPNYRPNPQIETIECRYIYKQFNWKPRYRRFVVVCCTHGNYDIAVEKLRRIWKFWFYLSMYDNAMGSKHKLNNQHIHFHSLVHILAGLNENQRLPAQYQELLYLIWYWRLSQHWKNYCKSTKP